MTINWIVEQVESKQSCIEQISYYGQLRTLTNECQQYLDLYEKVWNQMFQIKNSFISDTKSIAEKIYYKTQKNYDKKLKNREYYRGNCSAFNIVLRKVLDQLNNNSPSEQASIKLRGLIRTYIKDSLLLINDYQKSKNNEALFPIYQTKNPDYSLYYDTCEQIIFGQSNFDHPSDTNEVTPALIRFMIELRLKLSMGISGYNVSSSPGNMSDFFEVYKYFINSNQITVDSKIDIIQAIYQWGNIYIHTEIRQYSWLTGFAIHLLHPFFYGNGERRRQSGVRVQSQTTIYDFYDKLKHHHAQKSKNREISVEIQPSKLGFICTDNNGNPIPCRNHYTIYEKVISGAYSGNKMNAA
ncbi:MAG: hypothetical protein QNJ47_16000 [Nostocaceae cyanobacterium]|nr:hypothetical protein [Nostocaceae cyanobacterium]